MLTAAVFAAIVLAYGLIGAIVYGVLKVRRGADEDYAAVCASVWPFALYVWVLFGAARNVARFGVWMFTPRAKKTDVPRAKVVSR